MSYQTLPVTPSYQSDFPYSARVRKNSFGKGNGYAQTAPDGINTIVGALNLAWNALTLTSKVALCENFFELLAGSTPFYYTPYGQANALLWKCSDWDVTPLSQNLFRVTATLQQSFDLTGS